MKKIAIVYDWIDSWGGVERVLLTLHKQFPHVDFYTSYHDVTKAPWAKELSIHPSFMQRLPDFIKKNRILSFPLYPYAFESFDFSTYDIVISVTSSFAKGIITRPETLHICYLLTPTRYIWGQQEQYASNSLLRPGRVALGSRMRQWDYVAAQRPDRLVSISNAVAQRCKKYYHRDSDVVYPPFDEEYWQDVKNHIPASVDFDSIVTEAPFYLMVSRLEPYKKTDIVVDAFTKMEKKQLVIVGKGSQKQKLLQMKTSNVMFLENLSDQELAYLYSRAEAFIMPQEEDFGYTALEAQFFGCPVIAYHKGGASETVKDGETGIFFSEQNTEAIRTSLARFDKISYNLKDRVKEMGPKQVHLFSRSRFLDNFQKIINH